MPSDHAQVRISREMLAEARVFAITHASRNYGAYGANSEAHHFTGRLGELVAFEWLRSRGLEPKPLFRYDTLAKQADLRSCGWDVEVKSWRASSWDRFGPSLAPIQVPRISQKADVVLIIVLPDGREPKEGTVWGWSIPSIVVDGGTAVWRGVARADLAITRAPLMPSGELIEAIADGVAPARTQIAAATAPCGHMGLRAHCWTCVKDADQPRFVTVTDSSTDFFHRQMTDDICAAHRTSTPFAWFRQLARVPMGEAVLTAAPCRFCFPN